MVTGKLKGRIDGVWNAFWSGGMSNPLEVIEQITYLLFLRRLDDLQTLAESKAYVAGTGVIESRSSCPARNPCAEPVQERRSRLGADGRTAT